MPYLKAIWLLSHYRSSVHLKAFISNNQDWLFNGIPEKDFYEFPQEYQTDLKPLQPPIPLKVKELLLTISSATIERLLKPIKVQFRIAHRYRPHPHASVLKKQIPVEPHFEKPRVKAGYVELATVHHSGGAGVIIVCRWRFRN